MLEIFSINTSKNTSLLSGIILRFCEDMNLFKWDGILWMHSAIAQWISAVNLCFFFFLNNNYNPFSQKKIKYLQNKVALRFNSTHREPWQLQKAFQICQVWELTGYNIRKVTLLKNTCSYYDNTDRPLWSKYKRRIPAYSQPNWGRSIKPFRTLS